MKDLDWLFRRFASAGTAVAFVHNDREVSYAEIAARIRSFEVELAERAIPSGARFVVLGDYTPETFAFVIALARNGNLIIPLTRESVVKLDTALEISGCDWIAEFEPGFVDPSWRARHVPAVHPLLEDLVQRGVSGMVFFSSGSTGKPKGILHEVERVASKFVKSRSPATAIPFLMFDHFGGFNTILAIT